MKKTEQISKWHPATWFGTCADLQPSFLEDDIESSVGRNVSSWCTSKEARFAFYTPDTTLVEISIYHNNAFVHFHTIPCCEDFYTILRLLTSCNKDESNDLFALADLDPIDAYEMFVKDYTRLRKNTYSVTYYYTSEQDEITKR